MIFCAGHSKIDSGQEMGLMIKMFRENGMGNFRDLLMLLSTSPGMIYYLDNSESHKTAVNENYGENYWNYSQWVLEKTKSLITARTT
ncbi:MAG: hypothetical protein CM1200mP15_14810 [Dehalococcoidia bacterium]|nr:MAG: hypothetical protein CM1200mP15_14810 [Dehalococcoidia bacterium]